MNQVLEDITVKKSDFVSLVFAVIGGFLFSIGMCMCLVVEWNMFRPGVVVTAVGSAALLVLALVRWNKAGRPTVHVNGKTLGRVLLGAAGALTLGIGMCMIMVWNMMIPGIAVGMVGIVLLLLLIPAIVGLN